LRNSGVKRLSLRISFHPWQTSLRMGIRFSQFSSSHEI
jgi:hypothetical protein